MWKEVLSLSKAIGMIETRGYLGSIVAVDAMLKAADVRLVTQEKVDAALVSVFIEGDVAAVQAAVDAGKEAASEVGELIAYHVIPHADETTKSMLGRKQKRPDSPVPAVKKRKENKKQEGNGSKEDMKEDINPEADQERR